jgi:hypothetical protein
MKELIIPALAFKLCKTLRSLLQAPQRADSLGPARSDSPTFAGSTRF